jgi:hypothetical protein
MNGAGLRAVAAVAGLLAHAVRAVEEGELVLVALLHRARLAVPSPEPLFRVEESTYCGTLPQ